MFKFKSYVPDLGLGDIVVLNDKEHNKFLEAILYSDFMESNAEEKERKEVFLVLLQEKKEPFIFKATAKEFEFLTRRYEIEENFSVIMHEAVAEIHEGYSRRYKTLKANAKSRK
jgi:hypothetical protein